jgi:ATP-dependent DNA helicase RecG
VPAAGKESIKSAAAAGELDLLIGTHSLIEGTVDFARLGLVVMDEQHKFGVVQRAKLKRKGANPHTLVMTATPIPRTLMLTVFGDLDVSTLEKSPPGRGEITTRWVPPEKRGEAFEFIRKKLAKGRQAFFVYPLIEGSENTDVKSAVDTARELEGVFGEFGVQLVTGAMSSKAKSAAMRDFRSGKARILVATVVIEVGIDIPNASIMVVENAERFGLSQLHQLRGRIGRGRHRSYCLLFGEPRTDDARRRLEVMAETTDGFRIAEEDLKLRGPGEFFGTRQHGLPEFAFADLIEDWKLLQAAREDAFAVVEEDPGLARHPVLRARVHESYGGRLDLAEAG